MSKYWFCETPQWQRSSAPNESQRGTRQLQSRRCLGEAKGIDTVTGGRAETWTWASQHRGHSVMFSLKLSHRIFQCCVQAVVSEEITYHSPHTWQWGCISDPSSPFCTLESRFGLLYRKEVVGKPSCLGPLPLHVAPPKHLCGTAAVWLASHRCFAVPRFHVPFWMLL